MFKSILLTLVLCCFSSIASNHPPLQAVSSFSVLTDMVQTIAGDTLKIHTLIERNNDPHTYQSKPSDLKLLKSANIVFINGMGLEGWMTRLVENSGFKGPVVECAKSITPRYIDEHDHTSVPCKACQANKGHGRQADPHGWNSIPNGLHYIDSITTALSTLIPGQKAIFTQRAEAYKKQLSDLHKEMLKKFSALPTHQKKVITGHDAFMYLGRDYGIQFIAPQGISTETEPTAKDVARVIQQIKEQKIKAIFLEPQPFKDPRIIQNIAKEAGLKTTGTLYSDSLSLSPGPAATYASMMKHNLESLLTSIKDNSK